jgi:hypothetical protein
MINKLHTCYISAGGLIDLSLLRQVLAEKQVEVLAPWTSDKPGFTPPEAAAMAMNRADFVVGVLTGGAGDQSVFFELGYACALNKPIVVIGDDRAKLPTVLSSALFVPNGISNLEGLRFNLEHLLAAPAGVERHRAMARARHRKATPSPAEPLRPVRVTGHALQKQVAELLRSTGSAVVTESRHPDKGADFALWIEELASLVGNPILVEVKSDLGEPGAAQRASDQAHKFLALSGARMLLIVYGQGPPNEELNKYFASPVLFFYRWREFESDIQKQGIVRVIEQLRNRLLHGAG